MNEQEESLVVMARIYKEELDEFFKKWTYQPGGMGRDIGLLVSAVHEKSFAARRDFAVLKQDFFERIDELVECLRQCQPPPAHQFETVEEYAAICRRRDELLALYE